MSVTLENEIKEIQQEDEPGIKPFSEELREELRDGTIQECSVIFFGNPGSGKSSLIRRILYDKRPEPEENTSTTGIDVSLGFTTALWVKNMPCCLRFMDFGGQIDQTDIHRCFMTPNTIYVAVCDWHKAQSAQSAAIDLDYISRWLYEARLYSRGSPVIVALNKSDLVHLPEKLRDNLHEIQDGILRQAKKINDCTQRVLISSAKAEDRPEAVGELMEAIRSAIKECLKNRKRKPQNWLSVRLALEEGNRGYISLAEYREICRQKGVLFPFQQKELLAWLEEQGAFYRCPSETADGRTRSNSLTLLQSEWLTRRVYHVVRYGETDDENAPTPKKNYVLHHMDIARILRALNGLSWEEAGTVNPLELRKKIDGERFKEETPREATPEEKREKEYLLSIMRRLDLSFLYSDSQEIVPARMKKEVAVRDSSDDELHQRWTVDEIPFPIIWLPQTADESPPQKDAGHGENVPSRPYAPSFHSSILHSLMCRMAKEKKFQYGYKNSANFFDNESHSTVEVTLKGSELHLYCSGADGKRFLKEIRGEIRGYIKKHRISATEYVYKGTQPYSIKELNALFHRNAESKLIRRDYALPLPPLQKAALCLTTAFLVLLTMICIISARQFFVSIAMIFIVLAIFIILAQGAGTPLEDAPRETPMENSDASVPGKGEKWFAEVKKLIETNKIRFILGTVLALLLLRIAMPDTYQTVWNALKDVIPDLIKLLSKD